MRNNHARIKRLELRNAKIRSDFKQLSDIREYNVKKHTTEWILEKLGEKYTLSPTTILAIVRQ